MSEENVEVVRRGFEAFDRGDLSGALDLFDDEVIFYRADPDRATFRGKTGLLDVLADWTEGFSEWSVVAEEFIDFGDSVLVRVRQDARGESSGARVEGEFWWLFEFADGKVSKMGSYTMRDEALEAARVRE